MLMARKLVAGLLLLAAATAVACGSDDEGRSGCCRIQHVCGTCSCPPAWKSVGDAGDENACDDLLENPDVGNGCSVYDGDDAIAACS
jgi:hypothetical protein